MKEKAKKIAWGAAGFTSLSIGVVGIVVPGLPSTVFLLITAFCFARSSDRLHNWLIEHPHFGEPIRHWRDHGAIPLRAKIVAAIMMIATVAISLALGAPAWVIGLQIVVLAAVSVFIWTRPHGPKADAAAPVTPPQDEI